MADKQYDSLDIDWLEQRAREIAADPRFSRFRAVSPLGGQVIHEFVEAGYPGRFRGISLDAAVTDFDRYINIQRLL